MNAHATSPAVAAIKPQASLCAKFSVVLAHTGGVVPEGVADAASGALPPAASEAEPPRVDRVR